jgi:hypothetical protein
MNGGHDADPSRDERDFGSRPTEDHSPTAKTAKPITPTVPPRATSEPVKVP